MQAEIFGNGDFEYRYDLSRISDMDALTNVVIGAKFGTNDMGNVAWMPPPGTMQMLSTNQFYNVED